MSSPDRSAKRPFNFPLPPHALDVFRHPDPLDDLHNPLRWDNEVLVGNGHVALRIHRGAFHPEDFEPASAGVVERVGKLPWKRWESYTGDTCRGGPWPKGTWRNLDDVRGDIYELHPIQMFQEVKGRWRWAPTPAVRIAGSVVVPLSILQQVARLPRPEVLVEGLNIREHVVFRFTGGLGVIANHKLDQAWREIFRPIHHRI